MDRLGKRHISNGRFRSPLGLCVILFLAVASSAHTADDERAKRVLMISTASRFSPGSGVVEQNIVNKLQELGPRRIEFYSEYLDIIRFPSASYQRLFRDYLHVKYADQPPDLLMLIYVGNLVVAEKFLGQVFPGVQIVLAGLTEEEVPVGKFGSHVSGIAQGTDLRGTMELILRLKPETRRIVVIAGTAEVDRITLSRAKEAAQSLTDRAKFDFWSDRSMADVRQAVKSLPAQTAILLTRMYRDAAGGAFIPAGAPPVHGSPTKGHP